MTRNAVIVSPEKGYKKSMREHGMIPTIALIDPLLLVGLALVDAGSGRRILRRCGRGLRQNGQGKSGKDSDQQTGCAFHLLLLVFAMGQPHAPNNAGGHPALTIEM